jgi:predicted patatin/cPLA2 family phospholipase
MGLANAFDAIYASSAGFCNASYFLSGQPRFGTSIYYEDLSGRKFLNYFKPWKIANIDYMVQVMSTNKKLEYEKVLKNPTKFYTRLLDTKAKKEIYLEIHDISPNEYMGLLRAACSLPYLHPGSTTVKNTSYKDGGLGKKAVINHLKKVIDDGYTDILVIYNLSSQQRAVQKENLSLGNIFEIAPPKEIAVGRLDTRPQNLIEKALRMGEYTKKLFGEKGGIELSYANRP